MRISPDSWLSVNCLLSASPVPYLIASSTSSKSVSVVLPQPLKTLAIALQGCPADLRLLRDKCGTCSVQEGLAPQEHLAYVCYKEDPVWGSSGWSEWRMCRFPVRPPQAHWLFLTPKTKSLGSRMLTKRAETTIDCSTRLPGLWIEGDPAPVLVSCPRFGDFKVAEIGKINIPITGQEILPHFKLLNWLSRTKQWRLSCPGGRNKCFDITIFFLLGHMKCKHFHHQNYHFLGNSAVHTDNRKARKDYKAGGRKQKPYIPATLSDNMRQAHFKFFFLLFSQFEITTYFMILM